MYTTNYDIVMADDEQTNVVSGSITLNIDKNNADC